MQRRWTLLAGDSEIAVTGNVDRFDALATEVASHGYYAFVATPDAVAALVGVTKFDLVVVVSDVTPDDRDHLARISPAFRASPHA